MIPSLSLFVLSIILTLEKETYSDILIWISIFITINLIRQIYLLMAFFSSYKISQVSLSNGKQGYCVIDGSSGANVESLPSIFIFFVRSSICDLPTFVQMHEYGHFKGRHVLFHQAIISILLTYCLGVFIRHGILHFAAYIFLTYHLFKSIFQQDEKLADNYALNYVSNIEDIEQTLNEFSDKCNTHKTTVGPVRMWRMTSPNKGFRRIFLYSTWIFSAYISGPILVLLSALFIFGIGTSKFDIFNIFYIYAYIFFFGNIICEKLYDLLKINTFYYKSTSFKYFSRPKFSDLRKFSYISKPDRLKSLIKSKQMKNSLFKTLNNYIFDDSTTKFICIYLAIFVLILSSVAKAPAGYDYHRLLFQVSERLINYDLNTLYTELENTVANKNEPSAVVEDIIKRDFELSRTGTGNDLESMSNSLTRIWELSKFILLFDEPPFFTIEFQEDIFRHFVRVKDKIGTTLYYLFCKRPQLHQSAEIYSKEWVTTYACADRKIQKSGDKLVLEKVEPNDYISFLTIYSYYIIKLTIISTLIAILTYFVIRKKLVRPSKIIQMNSDKQQSNI